MNQRLRLFVTAPVPVVGITVELGDPNGYVPNSPLPTILALELSKGGRRIVVEHRCVAICPYVCPYRFHPLNPNEQPTVFAELYENGEKTS